MKSLEILAKDQSYEVIGLDWRIDPAEARRWLGPNVTLQGNMDPCAMYSPQVNEIFFKRKLYHIISNQNQNCFINFISM